MSTKVERTEPGSENEFRLTYDTGAKKWTNDKPGDGKGDPDELSDVFDDLSVKRGIKKLEKAVMAYAAEKKSGGGNKAPIVKASKELELNVGSDKAKTVVRAIRKAETGKKGRESVVKGLDVAMEYLNRNRKATSRRGRQANLEDVATKILKRFDFDKAKAMVERIKKYLKTKNDRDDISLQDSRDVYLPYDYGDVLPLSKKRDLELGWTDHAEYRSDLRDIKPNMVNRMVRDWLKQRLMKKGPDSKKVRMKLPGVGTAVVDYDLTRKPSEADIVTVWASTRTAKLINDYGISDALAKIVKPMMADIVRSYSKGDYEGPLKYKGKEWRGFLRELATKKMPDEVWDALEFHTYRIKFVSSSRDYLHDASYTPNEKNVRLLYNVGLIPELIKHDEFRGNKAKIITDLRRYASTIKHEVTHAVRDAMTGHITEFIQKMKKDKKVREQYSQGRGHLELEFEIDAIVNSIDVLRRRMGKKWEFMTFKDVRKKMPGVRLPSRRDPMFKKWVKRLHREGLLTEAMRHEFGIK